MKRNIIYQSAKIVLVVAIAFFSTSCTRKLEKESSEKHHHEGEEKHHGEEIELTNAQYSQCNAKIGKAEKRNIASSLKINGVIDVPPHGKVSISLPYGGFLKYVDMLPGSAVRKGQLLAVVENPEFIRFQQEYLESLAKKEYLKADYERQKELFDEQVVAGKSYQQAQSAYEVNKIRIKITGTRLQMIGFNLDRLRDGEISARVNIYSPITGYVREVYANVGKYIDPKDVIMELTDTQDLHVELSVYENDIPKVKKEQTIKFWVTNSPDQQREAEIFLIGSGVREDRTVTVHGHLQEQERDLLPGMYVSANIMIGSKNVWTVPEESVVLFASKQYVFLYEGEELKDRQKIRLFSMKEVNKGNVENQFAEISFLDKPEEINDADIVIKGAYAILSKSKNTDSEHSH